MNLLVWVEALADAHPGITLVNVVTGGLVGLIAGLLAGMVGARFAVGSGLPARWWWFGCVPAAAACAATVALLSRWPVAPAMAWFAAAAVALTVIDLRTLRLPNALVYPTVAFLAVWLSITGLVSGSGDAALRAMVAGVASTGVYLALHAAAPGNLGMGDVKFAAAVGMVTGWYSWGWTAVAFLLAFCTAALFSMAKILARSRERVIAFGPFMVVGAGLTPVTAEPLIRWWLA